ncbi:MAG: hypothetical protein BWY28_02620 [bacterium ADurb.Bin236]|nr:MAG: hypothetical protein BWY28_02620 [bacterium ADurb.Bin236]
MFAAKFCGRTMSAASADNSIGVAPDTTLSKISTEPSPTATSPVKLVSAAPEILEALSSDVSVMSFSEGGETEPPVIEKRTFSAACGPTVMMFPSLSLTAIDTVLVAAAKKEASAVSSTWSALGYIVTVP